jgi:hypothetical protein
VDEAERTIKKGVQYPQLLFWGAEWWRVVEGSGEEVGIGFLGVVLPIFYKISIYNAEIINKIL